MGGGGGGGSTTINPTTPKQFNAWTNDQQTNLNNYITNNPLVSAANTGALGLWGQTPGLQAPLQTLLGQAPGLFSGLINQTGDLQGQAQGLLGALPGQYDPIAANLGNVAGGLGGLSDQFGALAGSIPHEFAGLENQLGGAANNLGGVAHRFGALESNMPSVQGLTNPLQQLFKENVANARGPLTSQEARNVQQQTNQLAEQLGTGHTLGNLGQNLLNRQEYQQQRQGFYQGLANQGASEIGQLRASDAATRQGYLGGETAALGQQGGLLSSLDQLRQGRLGLQSGIMGQQGTTLGEQANVLGQQAGVIGQKTGLQTGLMGLEQGLIGQQGQLFGQQAGLEGGLASGIQGLGITGLNALNTTQMNNVGGLTGLQAPIVSILGQNMQGQIAQAQANAQMNAASQGKSSGIIGGGASALGAIIPAVIGL